MSDRRLGYKLPLQCVGHEIAPGAEAAEAEILVAGYSFCYSCGGRALHYLVAREETMISVLRRFSDGLIEVSA